MHKNIPMHKSCTFLLILILGFTSFFAELNAQSKSQAFEISKNLDIYATTFKELNKNYVDEIKPGELNTAALNAMLKTLDPYTVFIPESKVEDAKFLTTGTYGGIGVSVIKREEKVFVVMISENGPAREVGLLAGDELISIDGKLLKGLEDQEISLLLKGQAGTSILVKIKRQGIEQAFDVEVFRKNIQVESLPYYGMLDSTIGYIALSSFTKKASSQVRKALIELEKEKVQSLIFDLRDNGGGLLTEAVNIINLFVAKDLEIVRTRSRLRDKNYIYRTQQQPLDSVLPIVFLVDRNTASASEILSGAAQDLDRAVIMGERTFGKGLVQNVVPLSFNSQLKITIAKYYIPSGRCVQAIDYSHKDENGKPIAVEDSLLQAFKTKNGRTVYEGRGVKPDVLLEPLALSEFSKSLIKKYYLFDFATKFKLSHDSIAPASEFEISEALWQEFVGYLGEQDLSYESDLEKKLKDFKKEAQEQGVFDDFELVCTSIQGKIDQEKKGELEKYRPQVERMLKTDIVSRYYFSKGVIITNLYQDKAIKSAMDLLKQPLEYKEYLKGE